MIIAEEDLKFVNSPDFENASLREITELIDRIERDIVRHLSTRSDIKDPMDVYRYDQTHNQSLMHAELALSKLTDALSRWP